MFIYRDTFEEFAQRSAEKDPAVSFEPVPRPRHDQVQIATEAALGLEGTQKDTAALGMVESSFHISVQLWPESLRSE